MEVQFDNFSRHIVVPGVSQRAQEETEVGPRRGELFGLFPLRVGLEGRVLVPRPREDPQLVQFALLDGPHRGHSLLDAVVGRSGSVPVPWFGLPPQGLHLAHPHIRGHPRIRIGLRSFAFGHHRKTHLFPVSTVPQPIHSSREVAETFIP